MAKKQRAVFIRKPDEQRCSRKCWQRGDRAKAGRWRLPKGGTRIYLSEAEAYGGQEVSKKKNRKLRRKFQKIQGIGNVRRSMMTYFCKSSI